MWFFNTGGNAGGQRMRLHYVMEKGFNGFKAGAAEHAWWPSPSPQPPSSPALRERKGEGGAERKNAGPLTSESHGCGTS